MSTDLISHILAPDEKVLWSGQPDHGIKFRKSDTIMIPVSFVWGSSAIAWETMAIKNGPPYFYAFFGIPYILIGLYLVFGRFLYDVWRRKKIHYALTDRRAVIINGGTRGSIKSIPITQALQLECQTSSPPSLALSENDRIWSPSRNPFDIANLRTFEGFEFIKDAKLVYQLIIDQQARRPK